MKLELKILNYRKTHTLTETGAKFHLTAERIRQIEFTKFRKRCLKHNRFYYNKCSYCLVVGYKKILAKMSLVDIDKEVAKEAQNRKRDYLSVMRRVYLIDILFRKYKFTLSQIATELERDRSTINHLANKYLKTTFL